MFGVGGGDTMNCGLISRQYDLPSKGVHAGGYDLLPQSLEAVHDGFLDFVIDQQPYLQGFYTVMEMFVWKVSGGLVGPADINTGLKFVTKDAVGTLPRHQDALRRQRQGSADRPAYRRNRRLRCPQTRQETRLGARRSREGLMDSFSGLMGSCCGRRRASSSYRWRSSSISRSQTRIF